MEGRIPSQMFALFCDGRNADLSAYDFAAWVLEQHLPPLQQANLISDATLYEAAKSMTNDALPRFLLLYEHAGLDLDATAKTIHQALTQANLPIIVKQFGALERIGRWLTSKGWHCEGLLVGISNCKDPEQLQDFQRWYDDIHAADVVKSKQYWSRQRYQRKGEGSLDSEFYAFYESSQPEPAAALRYLKWPDRDPRMHQALDLTHVWTYNKILPQLPG